jgi:hypothetical protein
MGETSDGRRDDNAMTMAPDEEFDGTIWHDCHIWGLALRIGDPTQDDWTSDLVLDIDFIIEWNCDPGGRATFCVAPATLTFHEVTDLRMSVDWGTRSGQVALSGMSIDRIERDRFLNQKVLLDRPYYHFRIALNSPGGGQIAFAATDCSQTIDGEAVVGERQYLPRLFRPHVRPL